MPRIPKNVVGHWSLFMEDYQTSAMDFYSAIEEAVARREVPETETSRVTWNESGIGSAKREYLRIARGGVAFDVCAAPYGNGYYFSWWTAIIVPIGHTVLALLGFFGTFMVTSLAAFWLARQGCGSIFLAVISYPMVFFLLGTVVREFGPNAEIAVLNLPIIGAVYERLFAPETYHHLDTASMFQTTVSNAVSEVIGELRNDQGLRALTPEELKPHGLGFSS